MGHGSSRSVVTNSAVTVSTSVLVDIASACSSGATNNQAIDIECDPTVTTGRTYELNENCQTCLNTVKSNALGYYAFQKRLWDESGEPVEIKKPIDADYQFVVSSMVLCNAACKACVVRDVSQRTIIKTVTDCQAFNNVTNALNQKVATGITQQLTNNQDWLSSLADLLGHGSTQSLVVDLTSRVTNRLTENVISDVQNQISQNQTLKLVDRGTNNVRETGLSQASAFHSVQTWIQKNGIMNNLLTDAQFTSLEKLVNNQNTINSLGSTVVKTVQYFSRLVTGVAGRVLLFVVVVVGLLLVSVLGYGGYHWARSLWTQSRTSSSSAPNAPATPLSNEVSLADL